MFTILKPSFIPPLFRLLLNTVEKFDPRYQYIVKRELRFIKFYKIVILFIRNTVS